MEDLSRKPWLVPVTKTLLQELNGLNLTLIAVDFPVEEGPEATTILHPRYILADNEMTCHLQQLLKGQE